LFWQAAFHAFAPTLNIEFVSVAPSVKHTGGVMKVLNYAKTNPENYIYCIDSDYRYLTNDQYLNNPKILQTYAYSVDNYKCIPEILNDIITESGATDIGFDFIQFFSSYSRAVYPIFLLIYQSEKLRYQQAISHQPIMIPFVSKKELADLLCIKGNDIDLFDNGVKTIATIALKVEETLNRVRKIQHISQDETSTYLSNEFQIDPESIFLFLNGHIIFNCVAKQIIHDIISVSRRNNPFFNRHHDKYIWIKQLSQNPQKIFDYTYKYSPLQKLKSQIAKFCESFGTV